jgi:hypothetical protein
MITAETLSGAVGIALSLGFSYIPGLKDWYGKLNSTEKRGVMAVLLIVTAGAIFGLSCGGVIDAVQCTEAGAFGLLGVLLSALVANQAAYLLTPKA